MPIHTPQFDAIDYSKPAAYSGVDPAFTGDGSVERLAEILRAESAEETLGVVWRWIRDHLKVDEHQGDYRWRNASEILDRGRYFGCAEHALVYGSLARACGIPTVWVKTLDVCWIREFVASGRFDGGRGHVYLEVFVGGKWRLLDAMQDEIFDSYDPREQLLPGGKVERYAYDKGGNARELVLSLDWEPWKKETQRFFKGFDLQDLDRANHATNGQSRKLAV